MVNGEYVKSKFVNSEWSMVNGEFMLQCLNLNNEAEQLTNLLGVLGNVSLDVSLPSAYCLLFVTNCKLPIAHSPFTIHPLIPSPFTIAIPELILRQHLV